MTKSRLPLIVACLTTFLVLTYSTIVTVAIPAIADGLRTNFGALQWVVNAYTIALACLLIPFGALVDRVGFRTVLLIGLLGFASASAACAAAPGVGTLIAARGAQGIAGAAMYAVTLPLLEASYSGRARHRAFAIWGASAGLAAAIGNVAGGLLASLDWRMIFVAGIPIALITAVLVRRAVPVDRRPRSVAPVDWPGMVLLSAAITLLVIVSLVAAEHGFSREALAIAAAGAVVTGTLVVRHLTETSPPLERALLEHRSFRAAIVVAFGYYFVSFGPLTVVSTWLQAACGLSPLWTSLVISIQPTVMFLVAGCAGTGLAGAPRWLSLAGGTALCGAGAACLLVVQGVSGWWAALPYLVVTGLGAGLVSPLLPSTALRDATQLQVGVASAASNAARQLGLCVGVAVSGSAVLRVHPNNPSDWQTVLNGVAVFSVTCAVITAGVAALLLWPPRSAGMPFGSEPRNAGACNLQPIDAYAAARLVSSRTPRSNSNK